MEAGENGERSHFNSFTPHLTDASHSEGQTTTNTHTEREASENNETFNHACDDISKTAYDAKIFNQYKLHHRLYYRIREQYHLPAQLAIRAISKVVDSYKTERQHHHLFKPHGAVTYDERILSFNGFERVSLSTLEGRIIVPMLAGGYAKLDQRRIRGQADLLYVRDEFYLCLVVEQPEEPPLTPEDILGVDFGIVNLASTSDGVSYSGGEVESVRAHFAGLKAHLPRFRRGQV